MKKFILFVLAFFLGSSVLAAGIDEIVFFGDSLTDNGRLYNLIKIPRSPPYYEGRFSNGPTWAEILGQHYQDTHAISYTIYAIGGATTFLHSSGSLFAFTLENELYDYYAESLMADKSKKLHVIWIGANDYLKETQDPDKLPTPEDIEKLCTKVVAYIQDAVNNLKGQGAQYFLIMSIPDLGKTPYAKEKRLEELLHLMTQLHNQKLAQAMTTYGKENPNLKIIFLDVDNLFSDLLLHPDKYNQKYQADIRNLGEACWPGGFTLNGRAGLQTNERPDKMASLLNSPSLEEAYRVGRMKEALLEPCTQPDQYIFWDLNHPTEALHKILSAVAQATLDEQIKDLLAG